MSHPSTTPPGSRHCLPGLHSPPPPPRPRTLASSPDDVNPVSPSAHPPHPLEPTGGPRVAMATAHNRKQGPSGGLSWGRNTGSGAEHRAALSVSVKSKTGQKDLMRTISPKKKEKKKKGPKKQTKPNSLKAGGWLSSRDPVFPLLTQCRLNNTSFSEGGSWPERGRGGGGILPSGPSVEPPKFWGADGLVPHPTPGIIIPQVLRGVH